MKAIKYITFFVILISPIFVMAQVKTGKIRNGKYVVSTGDTTKIVNLDSGINSPESKFLFSTSGRVIDSLYAEIQPNITPIKAVQEVNNVLKEIERDQEILKAGNTSLSYRLSTEYISANKKAKTARAYADSLLLEEEKKTQRELALSYIKYGNKPSYFINGIPASSEIVDKLLPGDVIERNLKTKTPNPNGEVWLILTDKATRRLKLPSINEVYDDNTSYTYEQDRPKRGVVSLPEMINSEGSSKVGSKQDIKSNEPQSPGSSRTIIRARTINNQQVEVEND